MRKNQENPINLETIKLMGGIIMGLLIVNSILFLISQQFKESKSLIKGVNKHESIRD